MWKISSKGRSYNPGKALSSDIRIGIIDKIIQRGGNSITGVFPGHFTDIASEFNVSSAVVSKIWKRYCDNNTFSPKKHSGGGNSSLSDGDLQLLEVLKRQKPSISYSEIIDALYDFGDLPLGSTTTTAIGRAVRHRLPSGEAFSFKKTTHIAQERFTIQNMTYTQLFVDYLYTKDPYTLKYFDECGVKLPINGARKYGHAPIGERAIEVKRYCETSNTTVNLMCGLTGISYMNTVDGPSNTVEFIRFFEEAYNSVNPITGRPCLEVGDTVVMDNCPIHHHEGGNVLENFLQDLNIELVYMPAYSPDFNPAEYVFGKLKTLLSYTFQDLTNTDLISSLYTSINYITLADLREFFRITGYLRV